MEIWLPRDIRWNRSDEWPAQTAVAGVFEFSLVFILATDVIRHDIGNDREDDHGEEFKESEEIQGEEDQAGRSGAQGQDEDGCQEAHGPQGGCQGKGQKDDREEGRGPQARQEAGQAQGSGQDTGSRSGAHARRSPAEARRGCASIRPGSATCPPGSAFGATAEYAVFFIVVPGWIVGARAPGIPILVVEPVS